jgi:DNA-binding transcriptional ArsR family regulator
MNRQIDVNAMESQANKATALLRSMCNETRLLLLCQLIDCERSVGELTALVSLPQSTVSQHLGILRRESLVKVRREAQTLNYSLAGNEARAILETLQALYCEPQSMDA